MTTQSSITSATMSITTSEVSWGLACGQGSASGSVISFAHSGLSAVGSQLPWSPRNHREEEILNGNQVRALRQMQRQQYACVLIGEKLDLTYNTHRRGIIIIIIVDVIIIIIFTDLKILLLNLNN